MLIKLNLKKPLLGFYTLFLCFGLSLAQANADFTPLQNPEMDLVKTERPIVIDGDLSDEGWQVATKANQFTEFQPSENIKPLVESEVWVTYDESNLYLGFIVKDDPEKIRATKQKRDNVWEDDFVGIGLDTYNANAWFVFLAANPYGIQLDSRNDGNNDDESFDVVFTSEGKITETGYQVEFAIPFSSLSFPQKDVHNWSINFLVNHPRDSRHMYAWGAISMNNSCVICQFGKINNLEGIKGNPKKLQILPALVGSNEGELADYDDPTSTFERENIGTHSFDPSLNLKYNINSNTSTELTLNPDFSQIESDADQISVNTTLALFFDERRPFFQEGADLYDVSSNFNFGSPFLTVYTRSINNPIVAAKFTGRYGNTNIGYIGGYDENSPLLIPLEESSELAELGNSFSNIFRVRQNWQSGSYLGGLLTHRQISGGGSGSLLGIDGSLRISNNHSLTVQLNGSSTLEPNDATVSEDAGLSGTFGAENYTVALDGEQFQGYGAKIGFSKISRKWLYFIGYDAVSPTFRAENGFVSQNNYRTLNTFQQVQFYPKNSFFTQISPSLFIGQIWNFDGIRKDQFVGLGVNAQMKGQTNLNLTYIAVSNERYQGIDFRGIQRLMMNVNSNFKESLGGGFSLSYGESIARDDLKMGIGTNGSAWLNLRPTDSFSLTPRITYAQLADKETSEEFFRGYILRTTLNYQASRMLSFRTIVQYNDFSKGISWQPLVTYQLNPFSVFYVGANLNQQDADKDLFPNEGFYTTQSSFFFKFQYLFKV